MRRTETKILVLLLIPLLFFLLTMSPSFADNLSITGNGSNSQNDINVSNSDKTTVNQQNNAAITNDVNSSANTGENSANSNTGGNVGITTGNATSNVNINNQANLNQAQVGCCGTPTPTSEPPTPTITPGEPILTPTPTGTIPSVGGGAAGGGAGGAGAAGAAGPGAAAGEVAGVSAEILPVSGSNTTFVLILMSVVTFLSGLYLKIRTVKPLIKLLKN